MMIVEVDSGPLWLQYVVAFGTLGAALFAGWAALVARRSTRAAEKLIALEVARDASAAEEAVWHQARRVSVDLVGQKSLLPDGRTAHDMHLSVLNGSRDPVFKSRFKIGVGKATWGPQLVGTLGPGQRVAVTARIIGADDDSDANGMARFVDVDGNAWIAEARGPLVRDSTDATKWVEEARQFAQRSLTAEERGTVDGPAVGHSPDFDTWRREVQEAEPWPPDANRDR